MGYNFDEYNRVSTSYEIIDTKVDYDKEIGWPIDLVKSADDLSQAQTKTHLTNFTYENRNDIALTKVYTNYSDFKREYTDTSRNKYKGSIKEYGLNTSIDYLSSSNVTIGADYKKFENKANIDKEYNNRGLFMANTNKFFDDKTIFTQALRYDRYSDFENKTTGKIGLKQYIIDDLNISSNYGTGYNIPTTFELYDASSGNINLKPEKTKSYDVGIEYKGFSATYFNSKIENLIDWVVITPPWSGSYDNIEGKSRFKGLELAYKNYITEDIFLNLNYARLSAKNKDKEEFGRRPKDKVGFGVDYYGLKAFQFNINAEYIGERYDFNNKQGAKTGNYTIWNAVVDYDINKTFSTYLKLDNILNKDYQVIDGYATSQRAAYIGLKASF